MLNTILPAPKQAICLDCQDTTVFGSVDSKVHPFTTCANSFWCRVSVAETKIAPEKMGLEDDPFLLARPFLRGYVIYTSLDGI